MQHVIVIENLKEIQSLGIRGKICLVPKKINIDKLAFDSTHINIERGRTAAEKDAKDFIRNARVSIERYQGQFENYMPELQSPQRVIKHLIKR